MLTFLKIAYQAGVDAALEKLGALPLKLLASMRAEGKSPAEMAKLTRYLSRRRARENWGPIQPPPNYVPDPNWKPAIPSMEERSRLFASGLDEQYKRQFSSPPALVSTPAAAQPRVTAPVQPPLISPLPNPATNPGFRA